jgi:signal transduction histidine kinase
LNHVCFHVADLEDAYTRLLDHGGVGVWEPRQSPEPGQRMAYVTDPDGNLIELVASASGTDAAGSAAWARHPGQATGRRPHR